MRFGCKTAITGLVGATLLVVGLGCETRPAVESSTTEAKVKGTVTIKGKTASKGTVQFDPANYMRKDVVARETKINPDGTYEITTLVGLNTIKVLGPEAEKAGVGYSTIEYDVQAGEQTLDIRLPQE